MAQYIKDKLCLFRCIESHRKSTAKITQNWVKKLYSELRTYCSANSSIKIPQDSDEFKGIQMLQLPLVEKCYQTNINVFSLQENGETVFEYTWKCYFDDTINVNRFENRLSLITNINLYSNKYRCTSCDKLFVSHKKMYQAFKDLQFEN